MSTRDERPILLILGSMADPHIERVVQRLEGRGKVDALVVDYLRHAPFQLRTTTSGDIVFHVGGRRLPSRYLVWDRTKLGAGSPWALPGEQREAGYATQEWLAFNRLICGLNGAQVLNSLQSRLCMIKPYQQAVAARNGLLTPETLITNDKDSAVAFLDECADEMIMKSISAGRVKPLPHETQIPYVVMTMRVSGDDLQAATKDELGYCPHFFQKEIKKKHELRVVYVDGATHAFQIRSQKSRITEVDWRKGHEFVEFNPCELDAKTYRSIDGFMRELGLFSGSIDLIVDHEDKVWFLECNQDGQWGWLDDLVGGTVADTFALAFESRLLALEPPALNLA